MIGVTVLVSVTVFLFRLSNQTIELIGQVFAASIFILFFGCFVLFGAIAKQKYRGIKAEADEKEYKAKSSRYNIHQDGFGMIHLHDLTTNIIENLSANPTTHHNGTWVEPHPAQAAAWFALVGKKGTESPVNLLPETTESIPELLPILDNAERVLVKGPSDSGKTTLFKNIAIRSQNVVVIDPHYAPNTWPSHCRIVGKGRNHQEISLFFDWLSKELDRRYKLRAEGNENYKPLVIIIDEWMSISTRCDNATAIITEMITESRKTKMRLFIGSHSDQVEALGIRGQGKLREGLLIVRLYFDQFTKERSATFDYGKGERACLIPSVAPQLESEQFELPELKVPDLVIEGNLNSKEVKILEMLQKGATNKEIGQEVFGVDYPTGNQLYTINRIRKIVTG